MSLPLCRLQAHRLDTTLDTESEREYILFLCPTGPFLNEVSKFYEQSYSECGSNSAHNLFPHVTLSSFFKVRCIFFFFFIIYMSVSFDFTLAIFFLTSCWWLLFYFFSWFFLSEYHSLSQTFILICLFCAGIRLCTSLRIGQSHKFYQQRFTSQTRSNPIEFTIVRRLYRNILGRTII